MINEYKWAYVQPWELQARSTYLKALQIKNKVGF